MTGGVGERVVDGGCFPVDQGGIVGWIGGRQGERWVLWTLGYRPRNLFEFPFVNFGVRVILSFIGMRVRVIVLSTIYDGFADVNFPKIKPNL